MSFTANLRFEIVETIGLISAAKRQVLNGGIVDLQTLPDRLDTMCKLVSGLPGAEARALRPMLSQLHHDLDDIRSLLVQRQRAISQTQIESSFSE